MGSDLLSHRSGDFGTAKSVGRVRATTPVCIDALGETWAGYIADGDEKGRMVLLTLCGAGPKDRRVRQLLAATGQAAVVRHPNVLAFLEAVQTDDEVAFVGEYLEGEPMSTLLSTSDAQSVPIPQGVALAIIKQTIDCLIELREKTPRTFPFGGICPDVVFVASFGEAMLRNPGLEAKAMALPECRKHPSSLSYRAPEQLEAPLQLAETADVFSLGVMLWELLASRPLFGGSNHLRLGRLKALPPDRLREIERRIRTEDIPSLSSVQRPGGALHPEVIALVDSMLRRQPQLRPQTLAEISRKLAALPKGLLASSVEIATAVDRLAGKAIERRGRALSERARMPVFGSKPPSNRATHALEDAGTSQVQIPANKHVGGIGEMLRGGEAPPPPTGMDRADLLDQRRVTSPMRPPMDSAGLIEERERADSNPFDAKTTTPGHARVPASLLDAGSTTPDVAQPDTEADPEREPAPARASDGALQIDVRLESEDQPSSELHAVQQASLRAVTADKSRTKTGWTLGIGALFVLALAGAGYFTLFSQAGATSAEQPVLTEDPADARMDEGAGLDHVAASPTDEPDDAGAEVVDMDAPEETDEPPGDGVDEADAAQPAPAVGPRPRPKKQNSQKNKSDSSGAFRPMGI